MRPIWRYVGHALLVLALAIAPRPFGPCAMADGAAMPCHDGGTTSAPAPDDTDRDCDCCNDPGCDPARCIAVAFAIIASLPDAAMVRTPAMPAAAQVDAHPPRPPAERLRPPIHAHS